MNELSSENTQHLERLGVQADQTNEELLSAAMLGFPIIEETTTRWMEGLASEQEFVAAVRISTELALKAVQLG